MLSKNLLATYKNKNGRKTVLCCYMQQTKSRNGISEKTSIEKVKKHVQICCVQGVGQIREVIFHDISLMLYWFSLHFSFFLSFKVGPDQIPHNMLIKMQGYSSKPSPI